MKNYGFQFLIFGKLRGSRVSNFRFWHPVRITGFNFSIWKLCGSRVFLIKIVNLGGGGTSKKISSFSTEKWVFGSILTFNIFYFFLKNYPLFFPTKRACFFLLLTLKYIFFSVKITRFSLKKDAHYDSITKSQ